MGHLMDPPKPQDISGKEKFVLLWEACQRQGHIFISSWLSACLQDPLAEDGEEQRGKQWL